MTSMLEHALSYTRHGISVIPSDPKTKLPYWQRLPKVTSAENPQKTKATWKPYMQKIASLKRLHDWFQDGALNITVVCGQVSGGLVVFDFDHEAAVSFAHWRQAVGPLFQALVVARSHKGYHVYLRVRGRRVPTQRVAFNEAGQMMIEVKGEGGVIQAPPSVHPSGCRYQWVQKSHTQIPLLTTGAYNHLLTVAQELDRRPEPRSPSPDVVAAWRIVRLPTEGDHHAYRLNRYTEAALAHECARLAQILRGSRNDALNKAAFRLGRFVGAGLLPENQVYQALRRACEANQYIQEDGLEAFNRTFRSGMTSGMEKGDIFLIPIVQANRRGGVGR